MSLFVLDTAGDENLLRKQASGNSGRKKTSCKLLDEKPKTSLFEATAINEAELDEEQSDDGDYFGLPPPNVDLTKIIDATLAQTERHKTKVEEEMEHASELVDAAVENALKMPRRKRGRIVDLDYSDFNTETGKLDCEKDWSQKSNVEKEMAKSEMVTGFEKLKELPSVTKKKQRQLSRIERSKTKGAAWYNMPATELTEEVENDLKVLQMRSVLDPKHFYKKNDLKVLPKYFQIGTVQHSHLDYYKERDTRKNKKKSLVEELLADTAFQKYNKRKYQELVARKDKYAHRKNMKKMKKLKKNK